MGEIVFGGQTLAVRRYLRMWTHKGDFVLTFGSFAWTGLCYIEINRIYIYSSVASRDGIGCRDVVDGVRLFLCDKEELSITHGVRE